MQLWEYKFLTHDTKKLAKNDGPLDAMSDTANGLGQEGWELVSVAPLSTTQGLDLGGSTRAFVFMFKRPVQSAA